MGAVVLFVVGLALALAAAYGTVHTIMRPNHIGLTDHAQDRLIGPAMVGYLGLLTIPTLGLGGLLIPSLALCEIIRREGTALYVVA